MVEELAKLRAAALSPDLPPAASPREVSELEAATGLCLPLFLRDVYLTVANGCFGPGYGLMPLIRHPLDEAEETVLGVYRSFRLPDPDDPAWFWPAHLLPICDWGCAIRSCVDCSTEEGSVVRFDPNGHGPGVSWVSAFEGERSSVREWLMAWASGTLAFDL